MDQTSNNGGYIRRFSKYNDAQLMKVKGTLRLKMSLDQLRLCASYFESRDKRDPSVRDLMLLDLLALLPTGIGEITLSEIYTNDHFCADTYADMMNKRRELLCNTEFPISIRESMELASAYLRRIGKSIGLNGRSVKLTDTYAPAQNTVGISNSPVAVTVNNDITPRSIREGDVLLLLHRGSVSHGKYESIIYTLLSSPEVSEAASTVLRVPREGLLPMLLARFDGICYDLRALSPNGVSETALQLIGKFSSYRVLVLSRADAHRISALAAHMGLRAIVFATGTCKTHTTFRYSGDKKLSFETSFLRALAAKRSVVAKLPRESKDSCGEISHTPIGLATCRYLDTSVANQCLQTKSGVSIAAARGHLAASPYLTALQTALAAILSTASAGCPYTDIAITYALRCPSFSEEEDHIGQILSAILGIYRLSCELAIPAVSTEIFTEDSMTDPELSVFSIAPTQTLPSELVKCGNSLYCVTPSVGADGLPDFDALRGLLGELAERCKQGEIVSVRVLCNERITDAVQLMETDRLTFRLTDGSALAGAELPLAILMESSAELPYSRIGYVADRKVSAPNASSIKIPLMKEALNRGDRYEVLILSKDNDADAINLSCILRSYGAHCTNLFKSTPCHAVAGAMMHAQLVILCGEYTIAPDEQITFAMRVLREAGGLILRAGNCASIPCDIADHTLEGGITEDIPAQILNQSDR